VSARTLLVGLGNPILGDDGIGIRLARDVAARLQGREGLEVLADGPLAGLDLVERLAGYARVILLDAFEAPELPTGTLLHAHAGALALGASASHVHALELAAALQIGRRLGLPLPAASEIHILGVVARETHSFSETLSADLERTYPRLSAAVLKQVAALAEPEPSGTAGGERDGLVSRGGEPWRSTG
jgi:hydrogenase maturation protease